MKWKREKWRREFVMDFGMEQLEWDLKDSAIETVDDFPLIEALVGREERWLDGGKLLGSLPAWVKQSEGVVKNVSVLDEEVE